MPSEGRLLDEKAVALFLSWLWYVPAVFLLFFVGIHAAIQFSEWAVPSTTANKKRRRDARRNAATKPHEE